MQTLDMLALIFQLFLWGCGWELLQVTAGVQPEAQGPEGQPFCAALRLASREREYVYKSFAQASNSSRKFH